MSRVVVFFGVFYGVDLIIKINLEGIYWKLLIMSRKVFIVVYSIDNYLFVG